MCVSAALCLNLLAHMLDQSTCHSFSFIIFIDAITCDFEKMKFIAGSEMQYLAQVSVVLSNDSKEIS